MSNATIILWGHALAALLFGLLAADQLRRGGGTIPRRAFIVALAVTALWGLAVAGIGPRDTIARIVENLRNLAWLGFMLVLVRRDRGQPQRNTVAMLYTVVAGIVLANIVLALAEQLLIDTPAAPEIANARLLFRMLVAVSGLILVHHLHTVTAPGARGGIRLVVLALASMWAIDLVTFGYARWTDQWPGGLVAARGFVMAALAPVFAIAVHRNDEWTLRVSRTVAWQSVAIAGTALYVVAMICVTGAIDQVGGAYARIGQVAFVCGSTAAVLTLISSPWTRAWIRVKLAKHLSNHRYDYRAEWVRFTDTLGRPEDEEPLDRRIVKAIADLTESPAGLLLTAADDGLAAGAAWNWPGTIAPDPAADAELCRVLENGARIVELDNVRAERADADEIASVPQWMLDRADAWVLVPLVHFNRLVGAILLARPPIDRSLDWEDFDLLRIAGRQVASYLAEARAGDALAEAARFDEFNRRFAFIMHDIKNLVSQLSLVARNAERHADNPDFRADMIATLRDSSERMNDLLARLSQHHGARGGEIAAIDAVPMIERIALGRRVQHPMVLTGARTAIVRADPVRLEIAIGHLVQNASEASGPADPVTVMIADVRGKVVIDVIDSGCGMSPAFVRDKLFRPFVSSKSGGFGIGAFEARQLIEAMDGRVEVFSREGHGTRFRITLPAASAAVDQMEHAA